MIYHITYFKKDNPISRKEKEVGWFRRVREEQLRREELARMVQEERERQKQRGEKIIKAKKGDVKRVFGDFAKAIGYRYGIQESLDPNDDSVVLQLRYWTVKLYSYNKYPCYFLVPASVGFPAVQLIFDHRRYDYDPENFVSAMFSLEDRDCLKIIRDFLVGSYESHSDLLI